METSSTRMTTKKRTTKKTSSAFLESPRHPIPPLNHPITRGMLRFAVLVCVLATASVPGTAAEEVRRSDERKFRWEVISDTRRELGVRVKQGAEYELTINARGFKAQTRKIDARAGNREELTIQMEPSTGGKP